MIELVPIASVRPSTYNPRKADPRRLSVLKASIHKLGFVLPLYADPAGEILSGHQRHHVATGMGFTHVPVWRVPAMTLEERKAVNVLFNRGTNDMSFADTPTTMTEALARADLDLKLAACPDAVEPFPCMKAEQVAVKQLTDANMGRFDRYARNAARALDGKGISMPIVATRSLKVVNGLGRLLLAAERGRSTVDVVWITEEQAAVADAMLNLLSMDFDLHTRYADLLRYNSFRRARRTRTELGQGFVFDILKGAPASLIDLGTIEGAQRWIRHHGRSIVDFGAGHLHETDMLRSIGVSVTPFEPYRLGADNEIDKAESVRLTRGFLADVSAGRAWDAVFLSSVLNSVPFEEDRKHIATICAALCGPKTRLYACASSTSQVGARSLDGEVYLNKTNVEQLGFGLTYEENIRLGDFQDRPKVQRYHSLAAFYALFKPLFEKVRVADYCNNATAVCVGALPPDAAQLAKALHFEFEYLPYPDGSRLGLGREAVAAFERRLGIGLLADYEARVAEVVDNMMTPAGLVAKEAP
jgi:hypothetical protein